MVTQNFFQRHPRLIVSLVAGGLLLYSAAYMGYRNLRHYVSSSDTAKQFNSFVRRRRKQLGSTFKRGKRKFNTMIKEGQREISKKSRAFNKELSNKLHVEKKHHRKKHLRHAHA